MSFRLVHVPLARTGSRHDGAASDPDEAFRRADQVRPLLPVAGSTYTDGDQLATQIHLQPGQTPHERRHDLLPGERALFLLAGDDVETLPAVDARFEVRIQQPVETVHDRLETRVH